MSKKEELRTFIASYGELTLLKDLSCVFNDLGIEWLQAGEKTIAYAFSDSSNTIADVAERLARVEQKYSEATGGATEEELIHRKAESEYKSLMAYFEGLSLKDFGKLYETNKTELISKLKRLDYLKRFIDKKNDPK